MKWGIMKICQEKEGIKLYLSIIRKIDLFNILFALFGAMALWIYEGAWLELSVMLTSTLLLLISKYKYNRPIIFFAYFFSTLFFAILFAKTSEEFSVKFSLIPSSIYGLIGITILIGLVAAAARFGTSTLSLVWLTLHLLVFFATLQMSQYTSFFKAFWSSNAQMIAVQEYYPFIVMGMLIGVFLEKFQMELMRDYKNR